MLFSTKFPVTAHTDHVGQGSTFVAISGTETDGALYIEKALALGATTIVVDQELDEVLMQKIAAHQATLVEVFDARAALAELSAEALGNPAAALKIIGVTGTKGKTTTTFLIEHLLSKAGYKTALLGGLKNKILDEEETSTLTTPSADYIAMFLAACVQKNVEYVVMEVSSHAISQHRVDVLDFDAICFTNLGTDHLDYHRTQEDYFEAKAHLLSFIKPGGLIVLNGDDSWCSKAMERARDMGTKHILAMIGQKQRQGITELFEITQNNTTGLSLMLSDKRTLVSSHLFGEFNAYNIMMAIVVVRQMGVAFDIIKAALNDFLPVPGRLNAYTLKNGAQAFVDFAHNPSSMESVLRSLRALTPHLIVVFGCGGNRDRTKRPVMGGLAARHADLVIVTDDNPRFEDRHAIIQEILEGISDAERSKVLCEPDRRLAIALAAQRSRSDSIIALLGKGHEPYYLINGERHHFDDMEEISKF